MVGKVRGLAIAAIAAVSALGFGQRAKSLQDELFYFYMPIAWRNGSGSGPYGDFKGMTASLPYLRSLGVTAVWMTPIHPSPAYHGYQYSDGGAVNPWFGNESDFRTFVHTAHLQGVRVFIDLVTYGVGKQSSYFQSAYGNPASPYSSIFNWYDSGHTNVEGFDYNSWNGNNVGFAYLNQNNAQAQQIEEQWCEKWLNPIYGGYKDAGVDGFRCDHLVYQYDAYGPNDIGYTTANFWAPLKAKLKLKYPNVVLFGEQGDWGQYGSQYFPPIDATFTKPLEFQARNAINASNANVFMYSMAGTMASLGYANPGTYLATFGDHDVDRLTSSIGGSFDSAKVAAALLMGQYFTPIVYYGDEIGMLGFKSGAYGTDQNDIPQREPFKWNAVAGAPMSNYVSLATQPYTPYSHDHDGRSVEEQSGVPGSLLETYRRLGKLRISKVALRRGNYEPVALDSDGGSSPVGAFVRRSGSNSILVATNYTSSPQTVHANLAAYVSPGPVFDQLGFMIATSVTNANKSAYPITLGPRQSAYLEFNGAPSYPDALWVDGLQPKSVTGAASTLRNSDGTSLGDGNGRLDRLTAAVSGQNLYVGLAGNMAENQGEVMILLVEAADGGVSILDFSGYNNGPGAVNQLSGTVVPNDFHPNAAVILNFYNGTQYVDWYDLVAKTKTYRGANIPDRMVGGLLGGTNPNNLQAASLYQWISTSPDQTNTGTEFMVPLSDIAGYSGSHGVRVMAFIVASNGDVSNQILPAPPAGTAAPGHAPNLAAISGLNSLAVPALP